MPVGKKARDGGGGVGWFGLLGTMETAARIGKVVGVGKKGIEGGWYRIEGVWGVLGLGMR